MLKGKTILVLIFVLLQLSSFSQKRSVSGKVIDATESPIDGVMVSLINTKTKLTIAFIQTNPSGQFNFLIDALGATDLTMVVKSAFYTSSFTEIQPTINQYTIKLVQQVRELATVKVKAPSPIIKKTGDTLRYKLNAFANSNDKVIADILPKIPGVEVREDGTIKYNGMPISNFFIDGDNVLDKRYNIATNNISKDIIDELQILENNQPIKVLQGISIPNNAAMNITFKKGFKGKTIGTLNASLGIPRLVEGAYNQVVLKPQLKGINYLKYNNTGTDYLVEHTQQDLGELTKQLEVNWEEQLFSVNTIAPPNIQETRYNFNSNVAGSANLLFKTKNNFIVRSNAFLLFDKKQMEYNSNSEIYLPDTRFAFTENQNAINRPSVYYEELAVNKNSSNYYLNNQLIAEYSATTNVATLQNTSLLNQKLLEKNFKIHNEFKWIKKLKRGLLDFNLMMEWNKNPQDFFINKGVLKNLLNDSINYDQTQQAANNNMLYAKNQIAYSIQKNKLKYSFKLGNVLVYRNNNTHLQLLNNSTLFKPLHNAYDNEIRSQYANVFSLFSLSYEGAKQKIDLSVSPSLFSLNVNSGSITKKYANVYNLNTSLSWKQQLGRESNLKLRYSFKNEPNEIGNVFSNNYLKNYRTLFTNSLPYLPENQQSLSLNYNFQRSLKLFFVNVTASTTQSNLDYILTNEIKSSYNLMSYSLVANQQSASNISLNISKYFFKLKSTLGLKVNFVNRNFTVLQNGTFVDYLDNNKQLILNFRPTITQFLQFNTALVYAQGYTIPTSYNGAVPKIVQIGNTSSFDFSLNNNWSFKLNGELLNYSNSHSGPTITNVFIDFFAKYTSKNQSVFYELKALNLLNKMAYQLQESDINFLQQSQYFLRPLTILLTANIKL